MLSAWLQLIPVPPRLLSLSRTMNRAVRHSTKDRLIRQEQQTESALQLSFRAKRSNLKAPWSSRDCHGPPKADFAMTPLCSPTKHSRKHLALWWQCGPTATSTTFSCLCQPTTVNSSKVLRLSLRKNGTYGCLCYSAVINPCPGCVETPSCAAQGRSARAKSSGLLWCAPGWLLRHPLCGASRRSWRRENRP